MGKEEKMSVNRDMNKEEKLKALDAALTQIEKAYGKGSVMKLGESGVNMNIETVPTGSISHRLSDIARIEKAYENPTRNEMF